MREIFERWTQAMSTFVGPLDGRDGPPVTTG
jgi:hypothetical protein